MARYKTDWTDGTPKRVELTAEELTAREAEEKIWNDDSANRKLEMIKKIRLEKLKETDYMANSDYTMPDNIKTWRQSLRDIPQDNTTEAKYDELLARDEQGNLTHSIWEKP
tara:strand:+ start:188 stop:520 length:333 start_codon:yes stop_codon:yes gene_type:complete